MKNRQGMELIQKMILLALPLPGLVVYMTRRSPQHTYQMLTTNYVSPMQAVPVILDALSFLNIQKLINEPTGYSLVSCRDTIGLRDLKEVVVLSSFLLVHTAGILGW